MASRTIGDRYEFREKLGSGGMGAVYRATDTRLLRDVAVKVVTAKLSAMAASRYFFQREARAIAALRHTNIVQVYDFSGPDASPLYLVMELIEGPTLEQVQQSWPDMPEAFIVSIGLSVAGALEHAHSNGVIHRDIKPGNILIESSGGRVLLTDFGLAKTYDDPTRLGTDPGRQTGLVGTPGFMSPEQVRQTTVGPASDIFTLGSVLYFLATGKLAFADSDMVELLRSIATVNYRPLLDRRPHASQGFVNLIESCLREESPRRPTATDLKHSCERLLAELGGRSPEACVVKLLELDRTAVSKRRPDVSEGESTESEDTGAEDAAVVPESATEPSLRPLAPTPERTEIVPTPESALAQRRLVASGVFSALMLIASVVVFVVRTGPPPTTPPPTTPPPAVENTRQAPAVNATRPSTEVSAPAAEPAAPAATETEGTPAQKNAHPRKHPRKHTRPRKSKKAVRVTPAKGTTLEVNVWPWGTIWIDGTKKGDAPLVRLFTVTPGKHTIVVEHPTLGRKEQAVALDPGEHEVVWFNFQ